MQSNKITTLLILSTLLCHHNLALAADRASHITNSKSTIQVWQPSSGLKQIPIWSGKIPDAIPAPGPESLKDKEIISNVTKPTITVYPPKGKNTGAAVVVLPGGGYKILAMDLEGTEICDWLTSKGITAILLKYRVPSKILYPRRGSIQTLQDVQRTMGLVRSRAAEWHINPNKIGVIGFSAGGHLAAAISTRFEKRVYPIMDAADKVSCRPDFAMPIYPGHLWIDREKFELNSDNLPTKQTPPTFLLQNEDDTVDPPEHSLVYYRALKKAGVPVEMHLYAQGGHAFGLRPSKYPVSKWTKLAETWLVTIGMIPAPENKSE
ncbi:MAG: alpha/beta hydrolase [Leptolyngbya sp.]|nr:alpha/beta hydrolase [Candidatus Melainabacteria bacterium]